MIVRLLVLVPVCLMLMCYNICGQNIEEEKNSLHQDFNKLWTKNNTIGSINKAKVNRLENRMDGYLEKQPNDLIMLWHRADIYEYNNQLDSAVMIYLAIVNQADAESKGWYSQNFSYLLLEIVENGGVEYEEQCCYLNQVRIETGRFLQDCTSAFQSVCGCEN